MPRVSPVPEEQLPEELEQGLKVIADSAGFIPDTLMTMAHRPEIVRGYLALWKAMHEANTLDYQLVASVQYAASAAAGCSYCQAHMAYLSSELGMDPDKVSAIGDFETDERFSGAEQAALRLAFDAGVVPNSVTDEHFNELREYFDEGQIVELVANISLMGFLNRYNDTMASELRRHPHGLCQPTSLQGRLVCWQARLGRRLKKLLSGDRTLTPRVESGLPAG